MRWLLSAATFVLPLLIAVIAVEVSCCSCLLSHILPSVQQIGIASASYPTVYTAHGGTARDQNSEGCSDDRSKLYVCAVAPSAAGRIGPVRKSTAWLQRPQACSARLSERKQMVTWIVQQVAHPPSHCLACSTLLQQMLLITDVLKWPHQRNFRIIKFIPDTLIYAEQLTLTHWLWDSRIWMSSHALAPSPPTSRAEMSTRVYLWSACWVCEKPLVIDSLYFQRRQYSRLSWPKGLPVSSLILYVLSIHFMCVVRTSEGLSRAL